MRERKIGGVITIIKYIFSIWTPAAYSQLQRRKLRWEHNIEIYTETKIEV